LAGAKSRGEKKKKRKEGRKEGQEKKTRRTRRCFCRSSHSSTVPEKRGKKERKGRSTVSHRPIRPIIATRSCLLASLCAPQPLRGKGKEKGKKKKREEGSQGKGKGKKGKSPPEYFP